MRAPTSFTLLLLLPLAGAPVAPAAEALYRLGPDSMRQEGVPGGRVTEHTWRSEIFEGTIRRYWIYTPAQYDGSTPAAVMVFQDGHAYVSETGPFRVFLQDGRLDLDNEHGNWFLANQQMAAALSFRGYDSKFVFGEGAHNGNHGGAILPDSLRWPWRDSPVRARGAKVERLADGFRAAGGELVRLTTLEGFGHNSWSATYAHPGLYEWLDRQTVSGNR